MKLLKFYLVCLFFNLGCTEKKEILHLSSDFKGYVVLFYNQDKERGEIIKKSNDYHITVPDDGIVFTQEKYTETGSVIVDQNGINKPITGHAGAIFQPHKINYLVYYIGDSLDRQKMKYLDYISLGTLYKNSLLEK